jgi:hypothetical protein
MAIEHHPDWFELLHDYIFKYIFYGMLFLLWLWWSNHAAKWLQDGQSPIGRSQSEL